MNKKLTTTLNHPPIASALGSLGFNSFVKSFGINIQNIQIPQQNADQFNAQTQQITKITQLANHPITLDNLKQFVRVPKTIGEEKLEIATVQDRSLLESSLKSMIKGEFVSFEEEIQNPVLRNKSVVWISAVYRRARLSSQVFHYSVCIMDRYFSIETVKQQDYQKLALTCLWISAKFQNTKKYCLKDFIKLCQFCYKQSQIVYLEEQILSVFNFDICLSTGLAFLKLMSSFLQINKKTYALANYILELSMFESKYLNYKKSILAIGCFLLACKINEQDDRSINFLVQVTLTNPDRLRQLTKKLLRTLILHKDPQYSAINKKFSSEHFFMISKVEFMDQKSIQQRF